MPGTTISRPHHPTCSASSDRRRLRGRARRRAGEVLATVMVGTLTFGACRGDAEPVLRPRADPATAVVVYQYHDAPVAPDYHRSYTVTVRAGSAEVEVDTYGKVLHDVTHPIDAALWQRTLDAAERFAGARSVSAGDCVGGSADELSVLDGDGTEVVHVEIDHCNFSGGAVVSSAVSEVLDGFDLPTLLATGA